MDVAKFQNVWALSSFAYEGNHSLRDVMIRAVYVASNLGTGGAQVRVYGTITEDAAGMYTYSATPADRLLAVRSNGLTLTFTFTTLQGDFAKPANEFFESDHNVNYHHAVTGTELQVTSVRSGGSLSASMTGFISGEGGVVYQVQESHAGTTMSMIDPGWIRYVNNETVTGTITGGGASVTLAETRNYAFQYYMGTTGEVVNRTYNNA